MIELRSFGRTKDGREVTAYTLKSTGGLSLEVLDWGGRVNRVLLPGGKDVALGFDSPSGWEDGDPYYGCLIGRYANRIKDGKFSLDGVDYTLKCNNFPAGIGCALHGSDGGWHDRIWKAEPFESGDDVGIVLSYVSPDGEGGFPGAVEAQVTYTVTKANVWRIGYRVKALDKATPVAMTQHVYFNLKGEAGGSVEDHTLEVNAKSYAPYDASQVTVGEIVPVAGTPFDFTSPHLVGERIDADNDVLKFGKGYDHCWVLPEGDALRFAARLSKDGQGIEVWTTEPAIQIYTGNWIPDGYPAKGGDRLSPRCGIALETGAIPDSPNKPQFPNTVLRPGEVRESATEFRFI
jgi:aldose 1-epimerase